MSLEGFPEHNGLTTLQEVTFLLNDFLNEEAWVLWPDDTSREFRRKVASIKGLRTIDASQIRKSDTEELTKNIVEIRDDKPAIPHCVRAAWTSNSENSYEFGIEDASRALVEALGEAD